MKLVVLFILTLITLLPASAITREQVDLSQTEINKNDLLAIEVLSPDSGLAEVSWRTLQQKYSNNRTYPFYVKSSSQPKTYYLDLKAYVKEPKIDRLLFFGPDQSKLISVKPVKSTVIKKVIAGWQEFWGPQGRERIGTTFTIIKPVKLFNKSIFFYLNWLIGLAIVIALVKKQPKLALGTILTLWLLLEVSSAVNNWIYFKTDLKFWGKSLEEKRVMQNYKDFYPFMKHAQKIIPQHASFVLITQPQYRFSTRRAQYYLFPRLWVEKKPLYVLLFDKQPSQRLLKGYKIISKFRPGAYILQHKYLRPEQTRYVN